MAWRGGPTGVEEQGMSTMGFPRNLGDPVVSARYPARGTAGRANAPGLRWRRSATDGSEARARTAVPPSEGNEVRRDGRQGVGASYSTNEAGELTRQDPVEGRGRRIADRLRGTMPDIPRSETISTRQQTIATRARQAPELSFTSLNHYIDLAWLVEAYRRTRKDGAPGIDGQTAAAYAEHLEENLRDLLDRAKSGRYRAPAVKRAYLPKGDGSSMRPIGVPTFEDKILQRAVTMVLEPIYEQDFLDCSYGFRPGRSAHQALEAWRNQLMRFGGGWVIELDVQRFFDTLDKAQLRTFLRRRVRDGVLLRLIGKWLNAGVLEDGAVWYPEAGTPQGGVASPLLANIFLHEVLDVWFEQDIKPRLEGRAVLIRFADDAVLGFSREEDARRVLAVLPKRFSKYGLSLHPEKTRLVDFRKPRRSEPSDAWAPPRRRSFDLLGFTHYWAKSRRGFWVIKRKTATDRLSRAITRIGRWCRAHRHAPVGVQHRELTLKLRGHYGYYGITGNSRMLAQFLQAVRRRWHYWLNRRSQKRRWNWERFTRFLRARPLPLPIAVHSTLRHAANP
jgi:RNA-directed DNA polymerase